MPFEILFIATIVILLNVLDSATTALCFKQYPDKELKGETNPFMRWLMLKNKVLAEVLKQGVILALVIYCLVSNDMEVLRLFVIMLGIVVLNNSYVLISRATTKRKIISPLKQLCGLLHLPNKAAYPLVIIIMLGIAYAITQFIWN